MSPFDRIALTIDRMRGGPRARRLSRRRCKARHHAYRFDGPPLAPWFTPSRAIKELA